MPDHTPHIDIDWMVDDVMRRWPATIRVFLDHRMGCVGCPIASFHAVGEAAREHHLDPDALLLELRTAVVTQAAQT